MAPAKRLPEVGMKVAAIEIPRALRQIPPLSQALIRALQLTRDPQSHRSELAQVLSLDQALSGHFLRMVNSAYYGLPRRIGSLDEAIAYLGFETVRKAVVGLAAHAWLSCALPAYSLEPRGLWRHSVAVAEGAERIASARGLAPASEAHVAGLFHDVGKLVLDLLLDGKPEWRAAVEEEPGVDWTEVEYRLLGHHHAQVSAAVLSGWNLPEHIVEAVAWHHAPARAGAARRLAFAIHIANTAALMAGIGADMDGLPCSPDATALQELSWSERETVELAEAMPGAVAEAERLLGLRPGMER
ncbi:MAG: HDOD domain-containing protein [Anaerolineae bacterium]|nr:HDOD domain-containing protein [Anaerolineae bacterium]